MNVEQALDNETLIDTVSMHYEIAKEHIADDPDEELIPTLTVLTDDDLDGERTSIMCMFADFNENRYDLLTATGLRIGMEGHIALLAVLTTEAWMVRCEGEPPDVPPREHPDKVEVAMVMAMTVDNRCRALMGEIHRGDGVASVEDIEPPVEGGEEMFQSNLVRAFWRGYAVGFLTTRLTEEKPS